MRSCSIIQTLHISSILLCCIISAPYAEHFYVKNGGNDGSNGLTEDAPLASLSKAAATAKAGDTILLHRGDVFRESISLPDRVSLKSYGETVILPVISGAEQISGWSVVSGKNGVFSAPAAHKIVNLFVNGKLMRIARYPNSGWLRTTSNNNNSTVVACAALAAHPRNSAGYWTGCRMRWRHWSWYFDTRIITDYSTDGTLQLAGEPSNGSGNNEKGWGFYLDGKLTELDTAGEWFYDADSKNVYLYPPSGTPIENALVEGMWDKTGGTVSNGAVEGICFRHFTNTGLEVTRTSIIGACRFEGIGSDSGGAGLTVTWDAEGAAVRFCSFESCLNLAISWVQDPAHKSPTLIENNTFTSIGAVPGYGGNGPWHAAGIIINAGRNIHIQHNTFDTTGYAAIIFGDPGNFAEYNIIRNAMHTLNDGAGIYTNCDSSTIRRNIIMYGNGGWESTGWEIRLAHGIWPEFLEHFKYNIIDSNTCAFNNGNGIFLPNNFNSSIRGNICYANLSEAQMHIEGGFYTDDNLPLNDTISGNVLYTVDPKGYGLTYRPEYDYGIISDNYYCNPNSNNVIGEYDEGGWDVTAHTLAWWNSNWDQADKAAKTDIIKRPSGAGQSDLTGSSQLLINMTATRRPVPIGDNGLYLDLDSNAISGEVELAPYSSIVLVHTGTTVSVQSKRQAKNIAAYCRHSLAGMPVFTISLTNASSICLRILDLQGRTVTLLADGLFGVGLHTLPWKTGEASPGLYLYQFLSVVDGREAGRSNGTFLLTR